MWNVQLFFYVINVSAERSPGTAYGRGTAYGGGTAYDIVFLLINVFRYSFM